MLAFHVLNQEITVVIFQGDFRLRRFVKRMVAELYLRVPHHVLHRHRALFRNLGSKSTL